MRLLVSSRGRGRLRGGFDLATDRAALAATPTLRGSPPAALAKPTLRTAFTSAELCSGQGNNELATEVEEGILWVVVVKNRRTASRHRCYGALNDARPCRLPRRRDPVHEYAS